MLRGDLALEGGGDPLLDTDGLGGLVAALRTAGIERVEGRFLVADGALPFAADVAPDQPEDAGYNPTISGLNLNFNRVQLSWAPGQAPSFGAPGRTVLVPVEGIAGAVGPGPIRHRFEDGREVWSLPAARVKGTRQRLAAGAGAGALRRRGLRRARGGGRAGAAAAGGGGPAPTARSSRSATARRSTGCCATCCAIRPT